MKLIFKDGRAVAAAFDHYAPQGYEDAIVDAPDGFDPAQLDSYRLEDGVAVLRCPPAADQRQARLALSAAGLLAQTEAALAAMEGPEGDVARIEWQWAKTIQRDHPMIAALGTALGLTSAQIDNLFRAAAAL